MLLKVGLIIERKKKKMMVEGRKKAMEKVDDRCSMVVY